MFGNCIDQILATYPGPFLDCVIEFRLTGKIAWKRSSALSGRRIQRCVSIFGIFPCFPCFYFVPLLSRFCPNFWFNAVPLYVPLWQTDNLELIVFGDEIDLATVPAGVPDCVPLLYRF